MTEMQNKGLRFTYFLLGIAMPLAGYLVWSKKKSALTQTKKKHVDQRRDITLEDSFPASDPPSAW